MPRPLGPVSRAGWAEGRVAPLARVAIVPLVGKYRGRARLERGLARMGIIPTPPQLWAPPPADDCHEEMTDIPLDATNQLKVRQRWHGRLLVDFAMTHLTKSREAWEPVAQVDCCHSECHRHLYNRRGEDHTRLVLLPIRAPEDVGSAYDRAITLMVDEYEEHLRRWSVGKR